MEKNLGRSFRWKLKKPESRPLILIKLSLTVKLASTNEADNVLGASFSDNNQPKLAGDRSGPNFDKKVLKIELTITKALLPFACSKK